MRKAEILLNRWEGSGTVRAEAFQTAPLTDLYPHGESEVNQNSVIQMKLTNDPWGWVAEKAEVIEQKPNNCPPARAKDFRLKTMKTHGMMNKYIRPKRVETEGHRRARLGVLKVRQRWPTSSNSGKKGTHAVSLAILASAARL